MVVLNSPGNPIGNIIKPEELQVFLDILPKQAPLIFDEIYENVFFNDEKSLAPILLNQNDELQERMIVTNSCSKGYRMYTKRVGWSIASTKIAESMRIILHHTRLTLDPAVQYGAIEALKQQDDVAALSEVHTKRWEYTWEKCQNIPGASLLESGGGFYCTIDCNDFIKSNALDNCQNLAMDIIEKTNVATVPGEDFGLPGTLRLSFTVAKYEDAIDRLVAYFKNGR